MKSKKKGIMVKFLVTILITIIIFAPTIAFISKTFRISEQAESNFSNFMGEIKSLAASSKEKDEKTFVLILDKNTFIFKFNKAEDLVTKKIKLSYPKNQCLGKECIVLCQEIDFGDVVSCKKMRGFPLEEGVKVVPFFLSRFNQEVDLSPGLGLETHSIIDMPRRNEITIQKESGKIYVKDK
ncbi:hypothetical protein ACFL0E_00640 [Nanoarchaeota archaeon]